MNDVEKYVQRIVSVQAVDLQAFSKQAQQKLQAIIKSIKQSERANAAFGLDSHVAGSGLLVLFMNTQGTGKTRAANMIAQTLKVPLYRVDLSKVVSKFIGETEKQLDLVFDAANEAGAVLLFDEADVLFSKRSELVDGHDRYANIEINYFLQRMEVFPGIAILATNLRHHLDAAIQGRLHCVIDSLDRAC